MSIKSGTLVGYVEGNGYGNTRAKAKSAAYKNADTYLEKGQYKRHCQTKYSSRSRPGGGRF